MAVAGRYIVRSAQVTIVLLACANLYLMVRDQQQHQHVRIQGDEPRFQDTPVLLEIPIARGIDDMVDKMMQPMAMAAPRTSSENRNLNHTSGEDANALWIHLPHPQPNQVKLHVVGRPRRKKGLLTIGIPSMRRRDGAVYVTHTLNSLIEATTAAEKNKLVAVVFLCDNQTDYNQKMTLKLQSMYSEYIDNGFIQVISVAGESYPALRGLKRNFNDTPERVTWRSKQVIDTSFLFLYAQNISQYYLNLEDDVVCAPSFVPDIDEFIKKTDANETLQPWSVLSFSSLGLIGKLLKSPDLGKFSEYLRVFYDEQPVDWLVEHFQVFMGQKQSILRKPTLFQHVGQRSTLTSKKTMSRKDQFFVGKTKSNSVLSLARANPAAQVFSSMSVYEGHNARFAYDPDGYFRAKGVKRGDSVTVVFSEPQLLDAVYVFTGDSEHKKDILRHGILQTSPKLLGVNNLSAQCGSYRTIAKFENGTAVAVNLGKRLGNTTTECLTILASESQGAWVLIKQIVVQSAVSENSTLHLQ